MPTAAGLKLRVARALRLPSSVPLAQPSPDALPRSKHSPALHFADVHVAVTTLVREQAERVRRGKFLDVGGDYGKGTSLSGPFDYYVLDPVAPEGEKFIRGDICSCPEVESDTFEVVFAWRMFEFVAEPWLAAGEMGRILKPGGLLLLVTCFSWRYHPGLPDGSQPDYWRYTHDGLRLIFEKYGGLETIEAGYDLRDRRIDMRGGKIANDLDVPPIDDLGGFRENWTVFYAGRKPA